MKLEIPHASCAIYIIFSIFQTNQLLANSAPVLDVQNRIVGLGKELSFVVVPTDDDGVVPDLFMLDAPEEAILDDNGDGTRTFSWQPDSTGVYSVDFVVQDAQDSELINRYKSQIIVVEPSDVVQILNRIYTESAVSSIQNLDSLALTDSIHLSDQAGVVKKLLSNLAVSESQTSVQQTPIDTAGGYLYTVNVEPGPNGDTKGYELRTVLRQGHQQPDLSWEWQSVVVDDRTLHNKWHTAPSVAVDKLGILHIAYNMHNFPWQYKRAEHVHDIHSLKFKGQTLSDAQLKLAAEQNKTIFPTLGTAEIPGNQVTYPAFYKDHNSDLYVSYRFAAAPKREFENRMMSAGVAVFNTTTQTWSSIGASIDHTDGDFEQHAEAPSSAIAFAAKKSWTSYFPKLAFDQSNNIFVSLFWRKGTAGQLVQSPCIVRSSNRSHFTDLSGRSIAMPVQPNLCGDIGVSSSDSFYNIGSFAISQDNVPHLLLSPNNGPRYITSYNESEKDWITEEAPDGATEIFFDNENSLYAVSSGIKIHKRSAGKNSWETIFKEDSKINCYPKVKKDEAGKNAFIHTQNCDLTSVTVYGLSLP